MIRRTFKGDAERPPAGPFTRIDNRVINDTKLTPLARLAMVYLLSKPDDWQVQNTDLRRYLEVGINKVETIIKELKAAGYLDRRQFKNDAGQWETGHTDIYEQPGAEPAADDTGIDMQIVKIWAQYAGQKPNAIKPLQAVYKQHKKLKPDEALNDLVYAMYEMAGSGAEHPAAYVKAILAEIRADGGLRQHHAFKNGEDSGYSLDNAFSFCADDPDDLTRYLEEIKASLTAHYEECAVL